MLGVGPGRVSVDAIRPFLREPLFLKMTEVELIPNGTAHVPGEMSRENPKTGQGLHGLLLLVREGQKVFVSAGLLIRHALLHGT